MKALWSGKRCLVCACRPRTVHGGRGVGLNGRGVRAIFSLCLMAVWHKAFMLTLSNSVLNSRDPPVTDWTDSWGKLPRRHCRPQTLPISTPNFWVGGRLVGVFHQQTIGSGIQVRTTKHNYFCEGHWEGGAALRKNYFSSGGLGSLGGIERNAKNGVLVVGGNAWSWDCQCMRMGCMISKTQINVHT